MTQLQNLNRGLAGMLALTLVIGTGVFSQAANAEKYQSRLNSLLLKKNDVYLPSRLVLGEEARFVIKAPAGSKVKVFLSSKAEGYILPNGTPLRVGEEVQELSGIVPESGVLQLQMEMPKDPELEGKVVYVDAVAGPSDEELAPIDLVDPTGRRTTENVLAIVKPTERGGPSVMPTLPGLSPQLFNQLTTMTDVYAKGGDKKQLLDDGDINRDRQIDQNPFINRGIQPGVGGR